MISHAIENGEIAARGLRIDPRVKIAALISLIFAGASTSVHSLDAFAAYYAFALLWMILLRVNVKLFLKRAAAAASFVLIVSMFLPFFGHGAGDRMIPVFGFINISEIGSWMFLNTSLKGMLGACSLIILGINLPAPQLLAGLQWFRVPRVFIELASFTIRYLQVIGDEVGRMTRARDSRGYRGKWLWDSKVIGQMIGTLFLRSYERSERIYSAMVSRGYRDAIKGVSLERMGVADMVAAVFCVAVVICARIFLG